MSSQLQSAVPQIKIFPKECLADEKINITVKNLKAFQNVTIHATLDRSDVGIFESFARYTADSTGFIDLTSQPSLGGSFSGVEPMGLLWSMKPSPKNGPYTKGILIKDVSTPAAERFRIFNSHLNYEELYDLRQKALAEATTRRWYMKLGVCRIPVRWKRIRGALFIPEGNGPFPAVIDTYGTAGGLIEYRASLLASRGFMCLALAYFAYDDRPSNLQEIDLGYFEEAKEFLQSQPQVQMNEIGIIGTSYGGTLSLACASYLSGFKCAVSLCGPIFVFFKPLKYKGRLPPAKKLNMNRVYKSDGAIVVKYSLDDHYDTDVLGNSLIEFADSDKSFLFLFCEDDMTLNMPKVVSFMDNYLQDGKGKYRIVVYPEAGHLLEPPNFPHPDATYSKILRDYQKWGGKSVMHAKAQERSWQEILVFLRKNLGCNQCNL